MGYYVQSIDNDFLLDKRYFEDVYRKMCELNDYHDLKRGGSYGNEDKLNPNSRYPENKWFSWMEYNYPETCKDLFAILQQVGFDYSLDENGNMNNLRYDHNKTGNEDYFLCCFAGYVRDGSFIEFEGEDYSHWRYIFRDGKMIRQDGETIINYTDSDIYEFGKPSQSDIQLAIWTEQFKEKMAAQKVLEQ